MNTSDKNGEPSVERAAVKGHKGNGTPKSTATGASRKQGSPLLRAALAYAERGWRVFPLHEFGEAGCACGHADCDRVGKHPAVKWGKAATTDAAQITAWWTEHPARGIGIATGEKSGITVLDIDGDEGLAALTPLMNGSAGLPLTAVATSRENHSHYYFRFKREFKTNAGELGTGLDVRNNGGYIVAPPSPHVSGSVYKWEREGELAEWPPWLVKRERETQRDAPPQKETFNPRDKREVERLTSALGAVDFDNEERWSHAGWIFSRAFYQTDEGYAIYKAWAARSSIYNKKRTYEHYYESKPPKDRALLTTATIYLWAREAGWKWQDDDADIRLAKGTDVQAESVAWIWEGYLARRKLHLIAGPPGTNKTTAALAFAATITRAGRWPDGTQATEAGDVLIWSGEDGIADTLVPRLLAAGADMEHVYFIQDVHDADGHRRNFDPASDMDMLDHAAAQIANLTLVLIDPVVLAIAGDSHKGAEVRRGLAPLVQLAENRNAAALGITHFSKNTEGRTPLERITGSQAFGAAARIVFACARMPDINARLLVRVKNQFGPDGGGFEFTIKPLQVKGCDTIELLWNPVPLYGDARELLRRTDPDKGGGPEMDEALAWLRATIAAVGGALARQEVLRAASAAGFNTSRMERACTRGKLRRTVTGFGKERVAMWHLP